MQETPADTPCSKVTPMLSLRHAADAIEFYKRAFNAVEILRMNSDDGRISHAEIAIGNARIMLADEFPEIGATGPETLGGSSVMLLLEVANVDEFFLHALAAGAHEARPLSGISLRNGKLVDPFGHRWMIMTQQS